MNATVHIDGAARGNPGPAAIALVLEVPGRTPAEESEAIGPATNNVAEYSALLRALERAAEVGAKTLDVYSDSELLVKQMNGEYRVKNAELQELYREADALRKRFERVTFAHVRRSENKRADFLCNEALDGRPRRWSDGPGEAPATSEGHRRPPKSLAGKGARGLGSRAPRELEEEAVALLNAYGAAREGGRDAPAAIEVWDRLWELVRARAGPQLGAAEHPGVG